MSLKLEMLEGNTLTVMQKALHQSYTLVINKGGVH